MNPFVKDTVTVNDANDLSGSYQLCLLNLLFVLIVVFVYCVVLFILMMHTVVY